MQRILFSDKFQKQLVKLVRSDKQLGSGVKKTIELLRSDVNHPSLRFHKLSGVDYWSISVSKSIRIIARWEEDVFYLLRIGTHDEVY